MARRNRLRGFRALCCLLALGLSFLALPAVGPQQRCANAAAFAAAANGTRALARPVAERRLGVKAPKVAKSNGAKKKARKKVARITEKNFIELSDVEIPEHHLAPGQHLVVMEESIHRCMELIHTYTPLADTCIQRVPPTCAVRFASGGKTTFLKELAATLANLPPKQTRGQRLHPILVTFNGETDVKRRKGERADSWLFRTIAHKLLPSGTLKEKLADEHGEVTCTKAILESYFAKNSGYVLLIDELNHLLLISGDRQSYNDKKSAALFLRETFLNRVGGYFIFTSNVTLVLGTLLEYMDAYDPRDLMCVQLPKARRASELKRIHRTKFCGLTPAQAIFWGRVPALVWSASMDCHPAARFTQFLNSQLPQGVCSTDLIGDFLTEVFTGCPKTSTSIFRHFTDLGSNNRDVIWIPCYMAAFLLKCGEPYATVGQWLSSMGGTAEGDGKAWESIIAATFALRYKWRQLDGGIHYWLNAFNRRDDNIGAVPLECLAADHRAADLESALAQLPQPNSLPALQLVVPSHSSFRDVDLFLVRRDAGQDPTVVMVSRQRQGKLSAQSEEPPSCAEDAFWMSGLAPKRPLRKKGWIRPSIREVENFLGPSLAAAVPSAWRP